MIGTGGGKEKTELFSRKYNKGPRFVRRWCVSIHLALSVQPGEDGRVIHLSSTVDGHYLWVVCLSAGVFCHDIIMALT